jgi:hypothetical protein
MPKSEHLTLSEKAVLTDWYFSKYSAKKCSNFRLRSKFDALHGRIVTLLNKLQFVSVVNGQ